METEIIFETCGSAGVITLNRPKALNAVTLDMIEQMGPQLHIWANDDSVSHIIIKAASGRAFSAGGDIVQLYDWGRDGDPRFMHFYEVEYPLNIAIKDFPKPYIALIDGIVMGGGVGVSFHGSHRIVSENLMFAMPETGIGLFPDVGGTYFLPRCPGATGMYLGLTGARLNAADAIYAGLATHYVPADDFAALEKDLCMPIDVNEAIAKHAKDAGHSDLQENQPQIDQHFSADSVTEIFTRLAADSSEWAAKTLKTLKQKSPTSLMITFRQLSEGKNLNFHQAMALEYRIVNRIAAAGEFFEGTRAVVIDKDFKPAWNPPELAEVSRENIDQYFAPLKQELKF